MKLQVKLKALALLVAAPALTLHAQTNLLQSLDVAFTVYTQGTPVVTSTGTNNVVNSFFFGSKDLIRAVSASGTFHAGDVLARATPVTNGVTSTPSWVVFNKNTIPQITPISTNVDFDTHTDYAYGDGTNLAFVHGETITRTYELKYGTTDEIRTLILSNSTWQVKLVGYAHGHVVPLSLPGNDLVYSSDYNWKGSGSGTSTNSTVVVMNGTIAETYFKTEK